MEQSPTKDRALSLEEAISVAIRLQQNEQWTAADDIYCRILEVAPDYPDALHFSGVLAHQRGRSEQAVALIEKSLEFEPERADWYSNLGIVLRDRLKLDESVVAFRRAIALDPDHANAHSNLGVVLRAQGKLAEAEAAFRDAIRVDPDHSDAYTNLGILLNGQKRTHEAVVCFCKVITFRPKHPEARRLLALAHCTLGEPDKAVGVFEEWLEEEPDHPIALHMLAACSGRDVPERASDGFIETTFDSFAASFDSKLEKLLYRAPALVAGMLEESDPEPSKSLDVLDAGCGTGLCGPLIAPHARRLVGVDLSARMLARAKARNIYDELFKFELTAYLRGHPRVFWTAPGRGVGVRGRASPGRAADLHRGGIDEHRARCGVLHRPPRALQSYAAVPRARAGGCESAAGDRAGGPASRSRRSGRRVGGASDETDRCRYEPWLE
jgi:predicted TPR repeat methyltransferase